MTYQLDIAGLDSKLNTKGGPNELSKKSVNENGKTVFSGFIATGGRASRRGKQVTISAA